MVIAILDPYYAMHESLKDDIELYYMRTKLRQN